MTQYFLSALTRQRLGALLLSAAVFSHVSAQHDPVQPFLGKIGKTIEETDQWWQEQPKAPKGAPNVVWILLDDVGFGATSAFWRTDRYT